MKNNIIDIKHITCIINLQNTSAFHYLNLVFDIEHKLLTSSGRAYEDRLLDHKYLVIYILPSPIDKKITTKLIQLIQEEKIDYVIIDELFPEDNSLFLNQKEIPTTAEWIANSHFSKHQSFIEVL
ncbi:hypothetical protein SAMN05443667_11559 [Flavobacterium gillisiae]|uniref:Uncharacterized protein n=1 Tax=Flavobacterium gillisiae TaxID=150146 RepID=A0A1H4FW35_9FLAO|nr:hypothetical protein [Flavobacterium gillisiae]SEB01514.1 hypothetical protein SAMN05443667_11559 [Flavobacterium gillisiae]